MEWIKVTDRLPENDDDVLVCYKTPDEGYIQTIAWPCKNLQWISILGFNINPTHWMPLPEPPKE